MVKPRDVTWFEVLCPELQTPEFLSSLQRALAARGYYAGPITGNLNEMTRSAVQRYQMDEGIDTGALTPAGARQLGLIAVEPPAAA